MCVSVMCTYMCDMCEYVFVWCAYVARVCGACASRVCHVWLCMYVSKIDYMLLFQDLLENVPFHYLPLGGSVSPPPPPSVWPTSHFQSSSVLQQQSALKHQRVSTLVCAITKLRQEKHWVQGQLRLHNGCKVNWALEWGPVSKNKQQCDSEFYICPLIFLACVCACVRAHAHTRARTNIRAPRRGQRTTSGVSSVLSLCGSFGLNSGQAWC